MRKLNEKDILTKYGFHLNDRGEWIKSKNEKIVRDKSGLDLAGDEAFEEEIPLVEVNVPEFLWQ